MSDHKFPPAILDDAPQYLPDLDQQVKSLETFIENHRGAVSENRLNAAVYREMIPECRTKKFLSREGGPLTTEKEQYEQMLADAEQAVKLHKAAIKRLIPEYNRLKALKVQRDEAKKRAEQEAEQKRREEEQAKERAEAAALATATPEEAETDGD